jgi:DNA replication protein DnaC
VIGVQTRADANLDRLAHHAHRPEFAGESKRKRAAAKVSEDAA